VNIVYAILGICAVIVVHELGHLLGARACGIRAKGIQIGVGNRVIWRSRFARTDITVTPWVLMGFLHFFSEDCDPRTNPHDPLSYRLWYKRVGAYAAGPIISILLGLLLSFVAVKLYGMPDYTHMIVERIVPKSPAYNAGIRIGDRVVMVAGGSTGSRDGNNFDVRLVVESHGKQREVPLSIDALTGANITPTIVYWSGIGELWRVVRSAISSIKLSRLANNHGTIAGPFTCLAVLAQANSLYAYLHLLGAISFGIGLGNLIIPLPFLDGSRILMALLEGIMRRPLAKKTYTAIYSVGGFLSLFLIGILARELWVLISP